MRIPASRKFICVLVAAFGLAALFCTWRFLNRTAEEPSHGGHPLSYWLQQYEPDTKAGAYIPFRPSAKSVVAIRQIGTNALPTLLQWMTRPETGIKGSIVTLVNDNRIPFFARRMLFPAYPKDYHPDWAILTFRVLGPDAETATSSLAQMLYAPNNARWAVMALCAIGPQGATALEKTLPAIGDGILRANIISQLEHGITPSLERYYAPFLAEQLNHDSHSAVRMSIAQVLGKLTNSATVVVPALTKALQDRDGGVRLSATQSLAHFRAEASGDGAVETGTQK